MSTVKDVARLAGVSIGTVSNHVTGSRHVQPETARKVQEAIEQLNYKPNSYAKNLRTSNNREIGIVLPNTYDQYYSFILAGIEQQLSQAGYYINLALSYDVPETEMEILDVFGEKDVCGLIVVTCLGEGSDYFEKNFIKRDVPVVFIDRKIYGPDINFISFNYENTMKYLLRQLHENGHKRIGLITGPQEFSCEQECIRTYRDFFGENHMEIEDSLIRSIKAYKEEAFRAGITFFQRERPTAVIATSQTISNGLEQAAGLIGLVPGKDMVMISFGQESWSGYVTNNGIINTMRPAHQLGKKAAQLLIDNLRTPLLFEKQQMVLGDKILGQNLFGGRTASVSHRAEPEKPLRLLLMDSPNAHAIAETRLDFQRKTGLSLEITMRDHPALLNVIMEQSDQYDICMYDNPWLAILVRHGSFMDISGMVHSEQFDKTNFLYDLLEKVGAVEKRYYGVPVMYGPQLLLYRKDLFGDVALQKQFEKQYHSRLRLPKTWFEFNAICRFFTGSLNGQSPVEYGTSIAAISEFTLIPEFMPRLWAYGAEILDSKGNVAVNTPAFRKAMENFIETFNYTGPDTLTYTVEKTVEDFYMGKTAMLVSFASFIADVNDSSKSKTVGKIGYTQIPGGASVLGSWGLGITQNCLRPKEAFEFIKWTCAPEMSNYFTILDGQSPLKNIYENDELVSHYPWLPIIYKAYPYNKLRKSILKGDKKLIPITSVEDIIYANLQACLQNALSADEAIEKIELQLEELIAR